MASWKRQREIAIAERLASRRYKCEQLLALNWKAMRSIEFEEFLRDVLVTQGHTVETTRTSGDQGADLLAVCGKQRIAIQVKGYHNSVSNGAVQEAHASCGFYDCDACAVITNSRFTTSAQELAAKLNCTLIDEDSLPKFVLGEWRPFG
jgi:restriction system protein/Holliday junction resolvase/Mrr family protein